MQQRSDAGFGLAFGTSGDTRAVTADLALATSEASELIDITDRIQAIVAEADLETGIALVSTPHTTCAVIVNEAEEGFARDFARALESLAPQEGPYEHNDAPHAEEFEAPNGYAHVRAAFLSSSSVMLPIRGGELALGRWQRIFFVELDRARPRTCQVTLLGRTA
jgi:secondary thiamine-phosphate synthase enzyme